MQPIIATRPWEMVAVDILKVPPSSRGNQYILVTQDYFLKWPFAYAIPDQKADRIVQTLQDNIFALVGPPSKLHSGQGRNFESHILRDLCLAFGVKESHTTPYHPMGDGLVERMNRSLLTLLRTLADKGNDWEDHLQLLLFFYRTSRHASTGVSPYEVLFGTNPPSPHIPILREVTSIDPATYSSSLQHKLIELRELVEANIVRSASDQQYSYNCSPCEPLTIGQQVLLQDPTAQKLDPRWTVTEIKSSLTVAIKRGNTTRVVHVNRVRPLLEMKDSSGGQITTWSPPLFEQLDVEDLHSRPTSPVVSHNASPPVVTHSGRVVKPVVRYGQVDD